METKKVKFNESGINELPNDKPVLYRIENGEGKLLYVGTAQRGRVRQRISDHLGVIPGKNVKIEQFTTIDDARKKESNVIKLNQPKYNKQGK